jgi:hypothetical protein
MGDTKENRRIRRLLKRDCFFGAAVLSLDNEKRRKRYVFKKWFAVRSRADLSADLRAENPRYLPA